MCAYCGIQVLRWDEAEGELILSGAYSWCSWRPTDSDSAVRTFKSGFDMLWSIYRYRTEPSSWAAAAIARF